jgi:phosphate transport system substrate-binding protein
MKLQLIGSLFALVIGATSSAATLINGAGATFPYPIYSKWFSEFQKIDPDSQINYQSIGSGGGIRQFLEKTVDFGASDAPMTDEQISKSQVPIIHIPTVLGAVVLTYNLSEGGKNLKLTGDLVADIFLGKITKWNDERISKTNPDLKLPAQDILVVHRSDGSGTSAIFTDYLSKVSPEWKTKVGQGAAVNWPTGLGGKGNEGVAGLIKQTPGSLGYVELIYAENNNLAYAAIKNKHRQFSIPSPASVTAAAAGVLKQMPSDFRVSITDSPGKDAYPISGFTYILVYKSMAQNKGSRIVKFLNWAMTEGQKFAKPMYYAPLPASLVKKVEAKIKTIAVN